MKFIYFLVFCFCIRVMLGMNNCHYQQKEQEYNLFTAIKNINELAMKMAVDQKKRGFQIGSQIGKEEWRMMPNPFHMITKRGLYLVIEHTPYALGTPWGKIIINNESSGGTQFTLNFMEHFALKFQGNVCENYEYQPFSKRKLKFYTVSKDNNHQEILQTELPNYKGTSTLIVSNCSGCDSWYEIAAINGLSLPTLELYEISKAKPSPEKQKTAWMSLLQADRIRGNKKSIASAEQQTFWCREFKEFLKNVQQQTRK